MKMVIDVAIAVGGIGSVFVPPQVFLGVLLSGLFLVAVVMMARDGTSNS